jgi:hypothetical protein
MYKHLIWFALLMAVCSLAVWAGVSPQKGGAKADVSKTAKTLDKGKDPAKCTSPRPPNRGCKISCKPCQIPVCEDGQWKYEKVDWPKEQCNPRPLDDGGGCIAGPNGQCPAECKKCVRN